MNVSLLMKDSSYGDCQKETMLDFILSWTLRRASSAYANEQSYTIIAGKFYFAC